MTLNNQALLFDNQTILQIVRQWGGVSSGGILDADCEIFTDPAIPGFIGYRVEANNAVVLGDPVCASENKPALAQAFQHYCSAHNRGVVYIIASEEFALWAGPNLSSAIIEFGTTYYLNPCDNPMNQGGGKFKTLRKKIHNCQHKGVTVKEYISADDDRIENSITELATSWQKARKGPQIHLCHPTPFKDREGKRWFYAEQNGKMVGSLILNELKQDKGWLLNNVMICENSPNGLSELLVISALQTLETEGCTSVTIGPVPKQQLGKITGVNGFLMFSAQVVYKASKYFYNLGGHEAFWEKFQPDQQGSYIVFPQKNLGYASTKAIITALNSE